MRRRSFRARMAILNAGVAGLVVLAFGLAAWGVTARSSLQSIDREIAGRVEPFVSTFQPPDQWRRLGDQLRLAYDQEQRVGHLLRVIGPEGGVIVESPGWPTEMPSRWFPRPQPQRGPGPPDFGRRPGGAPNVWPGPRPPLVAPQRQPGFVTMVAGGRRWRLGILGNPQATVVLALPLDRYDAAMGRLKLGFLAALPLALLLVAAGSWVVAQQALRPVEKLAAVADRVTASSLSERIAIADVEVEFARLVSLFNAMLERLQRSFEQARRFSADAAHELNTPLTILQGELEAAVQAAEDGSAEQRQQNALLEEVQRLKSIIRKLLLLSQADAGQLRPMLEPLELGELVAEAAEDAQALGGGLTVECRQSGPARVAGDRELLQQALGNLASNAVKYNRAGGRVAFDLTVAGDRVRLQVGNTGTGIPPADRERVFERFYRADPARGRRVGGVGLGMSIAREIARAHGGDLRLATGRPDWTSFELVLPAAPDGPS